MVEFELRGLLFEVHSGRAFDGEKSEWDKGIIKSIFDHRYDPPGFNVPNGGVVIDIGAHIGSFSIYASQKASKVLAYEPEPSNFMLFLKNLQINNIRNVEAFQMGVYNKKGVVPLFICDTRNTGGHSFSRELLKREEAPFTHAIKVETVDFSGILDSLGKVDFIKMDCEEAEFPILFSTPRKSLRKIDKMVIEYHNPILVGKLMDKLQKDFLVVVSKQDDLIFASRRSLNG